MATGQDIEGLIAALDAIAEEGLHYFEGPGRSSQARVGQWGPREVLAHLTFWHEASVRGMESVAEGGQPFRLELPVDEANARAVADRDDKDLPGLVADARSLHGRFVQAARAIADPGAVVVIRGDGSEAPVWQRFEITINHWREHIRDLQADGS